MSHILTSPIRYHETPPDPVTEIPSDFDEAVAQILTKYHGVVLLPPQVAAIALELAPIVKRHYPFGRWYVRYDGISPRIVVSNFL